MNDLEGPWVSRKLVNERLEWDINLNEFITNLKGQDFLLWLHDTGRLAKCDEDKLEKTFEQFWQMIEAWEADWPGEYKSSHVIQCSRATIRNVISTPDEAVITIGIQSEVTFGAKSGPAIAKAMKINMPEQPDDGCQRIYLGNG